MAAVVGQIDRVVGAHVDAVRPRVLPLAARPEKSAVTVEHHHRVVAAVEDVNVVVLVDPDRADLLERPAVGQFRPVLDDAVPVLAAPDDDRHAAASLELLTAVIPAKAGIHQATARAAEKWIPAFAGMTA